MMKHSSLRLFLFTSALTCLGAFTATAGPVDITLVATASDVLEVRVRPTANFEGVFSSLLFTIGWNASSDAHLLAIGQTAPENEYMPMTRSDVEQDENGTRYQIFLGFGFSPLVDIPTAWVAGQEYTIMTVHVDGAADFFLAHDAFTEAHNGDYYVSLGGVDETGIIYQLSTGIASRGVVDRFSVVPNPAEKECTITLVPDHAQVIALELVNAAGQVIWRKQLSASPGTLTEVLDLRTFDKGVYMLRAQGDGPLLTRRIVKK